MKLTKVLLVFSILRGVACLPVTEFKGECRLNVAEYLCIEDDCEGTQLHCEDNEGNFFPLIGPNKDEIDSMVNDGTLESSISVFDPNKEESITFDGEYLWMDDSRNFTLDDLKLTKSGNFISSPTTGDNKMLLVIIDALDYEVDYSAEQLSSDVFGSNDDKVNVNSIFRGCSSDELRIYPGVEDKMDAPGTVRVTINMNLEGSGDSAIMNAAKDAAAEKIGKSLPGTYANIYYVKKGCYPVACGYAAYAYVGSYDSMYQGIYITYAGVQAHEHGHNLGLSHSGEGGESYGDHSCMMGNPLYGDESGPMCFNPAKSWMLGWYPGSLDTYNPSFVMYKKFIGAGEWSSTSTSALTVVVKIEMGEKDLFVGFNRKAGANSGNIEFSDEVTVIEAKVTSNRSEQSYIKAHLKNSETYTQSGVTIKVCKLVTNVVPGYADVVIYDPETSNGNCDQSTDTPTIKSPTESPTAQTLSPTKTCLDDSDFVKGRGGRKRTCEYIGKDNRQWRINKWCNKKQGGTPISTFCCKTCKKCTKCSQASCADIQNSDSSNVDGEYTITRKTDGVSRDIDVYCHNMDSDPKEFLTLTELNYSQFYAGGARPGQTVVTTFTKIRLDIATLKADINDHTFSTSIGKINYDQVKDYMPFGLAYACVKRNEAHANAVINLSGTPFKVISEFEVWGYEAAGVADYNSASNLWNIFGGGYCGWCIPKCGVWDPYKFTPGHEEFKLWLDFM
eukprot:CAMPEP_0194267412 /NCGR_PEP_ID=MMETSP0169-20130528/1917_1 /TAXON_ID=218684 /ORGANISM="Corethron pennatum, Strain L29A3" /LENGTH=728 /DNA_ID=CAMNT_0039008239 /DNA_START=119 /DNA_END=2308 /DNA_ORIENTATION=+